VSMYNAITEEQIAKLVRFIDTFFGAAE
jgi:hypothetical protein